MNPRVGGVLRIGVCRLAWQGVAGASKGMSNLVDEQIEVSKIRIGDGAYCNDCPSQVPDLES